MKQDKQTKLPELKEQKSLTQKKTAKEILELIATFSTDFDAKRILHEAHEEISQSEKGLHQINPDEVTYKAFTLLEFEKGVLLAAAIPEKYRVFAVDLSQKIQSEFNCFTPTEKATAELVTLNYIRTLEIQNRINAYLGIGTVSEIGVKYLAILSQELDRANRHYLNAVQALKLMKQPQLGVNIRAQTAVIGQNQMVQANSNANVP